MFNIFKKKNNRRLAGTEVVEKFDTRPIPYRTRYGGSRPTDYKETRKMTKLYKAALSDLESVISQGLVDEYSDPKMFEAIVDAYYKQVENEVERQYITFSEVIYSIRNVAKEELHRGKRVEEILKAAIKVNENIEKGKGDSYVEIEK